MRIVKDTTGTNREVAIRGTNIIVKFQNNYAQVDDQFIHHFEFYPDFEILPKGATIPTQTVDVKTEKSDNKDIKTESLDKKS